MILTRLTLRNFCLYSGKHQFNLEPAIRDGRTAPIVLFGGVNGAGKTTILDAVQLVLFGKRAQCSKRFDKPYDQFLRESFHHGADVADGASVGLAFRFAARGKEDLFEVVRAWKVRSATVREIVRVRKNGEYDEWLSSNWNQVVEELIPFGIAQLCFFDAEKIRYLADDDTSNQALGEAIRSLLGLDLAEKLVADTDVLRSRIVKRSQDEVLTSQLDELETELENVNRQIEQLVQELGSFENPRLSAQERLRRGEEEFARTGGKHWNSRSELKSKKAALEQSRSEIQRQFVELASGELPLTLVNDLLQRVNAQARRERQSSNESSIIDLLEQRDKALLAHLRDVPVKQEKILKTVDAYLSQERKSRLSEDNCVRRLNLSEGGDARLSQLLNGQLTTPLSQAEQLLNDFESCGRELSAVQRSLNSVPAEESIRGIAQEIKEAAMEVSTCEQNVRRVDKQLSTLRFQRDELVAKRTKALEKAVNSDIQLEEDERVSRLLGRTRVAMTSYLQIATARKIDRLSERITESFRFLIRKESLVERVLIDPKTFAIVLYGSDGSVVPKHRLSEGEKQLFAVSVLWGLARSSSRPLPAIIDTPMGRLDAKHRDHLVERYFPHASHQVIVLSTDTEVERQYFEALDPWIARAYHLRYDEKMKQTAADEGYFWEHATEEASR